jgi:RPC5 protein
MNQNLFAKLSFWRHDTQQKDTQHFEKSINLYKYLQYPVRPSTMPYNPSSMLAARFKPEQKQVEIDVALDTTSGNFNKSKAEQVVLIMKYIFSSPKNGPAFI